MTKLNPSCDQTHQTVTRAQLPLRCPLPDQTLWNAHPAVYLPVDTNPNQKATCPYCGTHYELLETIDDSDDANT